MCVFSCKANPTVYVISVTSLSYIVSYLQMIWDQRFGDEVPLTIPVGCHWRVAVWLQRIWWAEQCRAQPRQSGLFGTYKNECTRWTLQRAWTVTWKHPDCLNMDISASLFYKAGVSMGSVSLEHCWRIDWSSQSMWSPFPEHINKYPILSQCSPVHQSERLQPNPPFMQAE